MMSALFTLMVVLCAFSALASSSNSKPEFCKNYDCPNYRVEKSTKDYELRSYEKTYWVMTEMERESEMWEDPSKMIKSFWKLFMYIQGVNEKGMKMQMTVPVLTTHESNKVMMGFMIPQNMSTSAPKPIDQSLSLVTRDAMKIYVRSFSGWAYDFLTQENHYKTELEKLKKALEKDSIDYGSKFITAVYDDPFKFLDRHNEVGIPEQ